MSLLFNQITATLSADSVSVLSQSRGLSKRIVEQSNSPVTQLGSEPAWQHAISHFESLLSSIEVKAKTQLKVILSSHFVRYLVLPAQPIAMNKQEKSAYAIAAYREVYGAAVDGWQIKLQDTAPNQPVIAVAIDENLVTALKQTSEKYQLKLTSVQPYLMSAFNTVSNLLGNINGYLAILESGRLLLISLIEGKCQHVRSIAISDSWQAELTQLLMRESVMGDVAGKEVLVYAANEKNAKLDKIDGWNIRQIGHLHNKHFSGTRLMPQRVSA